MNTKRRLLVAALENNGSACKVIDRLALMVSAAARREYVWRGKAGCQFGRIEPIYDNHRPVLLKGIDGLDLGLFEGREDCERGEGILVVTWSHGSIPLDVTVFPPQTYFRGIFMDGERRVFGMRKIILLSDCRELDNFGLMVEQAASAIMAGLTNEWVDKLLFRRPIVAQAGGSSVDQPTAGA